ncbi:NACHT, LRR and PYD domains-containing protein 1a-like [Archocentrus centrarchus]|uniref:NACHT, LRR and PYD domains-containing protein 1a-like n=1 Tax=Archocentrus centrarchus TaxID=63155 RepID=UPI0011EA00F8|nr:NACHT, LRR and PYD domains-containing protein 1a-like [Archocentrus centrarchus]XP_030603078.1 NACHT, LRR and PYD domains-containing protein 1a-like [Archocentrus centrarchus]XP_030603079.1 NACHT, LRR and PYD domains-containing protein 1a-like [Archocentrus centrarchus]XP_030603081.1 NACHT, LRR and PYD domains-containing protein 1a-like [Archocentrus centrarchus]
MSAISEEAWRITLTVILEELDEPQYKKMLLFLSEIPKRVKTKSREEMPQLIIEHYGVETSIHRINEVMDQIPRKDAAVQDRLRPFVDKLKNTQQKTGERHFVDEHMCELIQRVSNIGPILDELLQEQVIQQEAYDRIRALPNSQDKMRELYSGPVRAGTASRDAFYRILQNHEKMLTEDLRR